MLTSMSFVQKLEQELRDARAEIARLMALAQHESMRDPSST